MAWTQFDDGQLQTRRDIGGQPSSYDHDAHNLLTAATDAADITSPGEATVRTEASYTGFDEVAKVATAMESDEGNGEPHTQAWPCTPGVCANPTGPAPSQPPTPAA
jgi:YD repeat-containing protein